MHSFHRTAHLPSTSTPTPTSDAASPSPSTSAHTTPTRPRTSARPSLLSISKHKASSSASSLSVPQIKRSASAHSALAGARHHGHGFDRDDGATDDNGQGMGGGGDAQDSSSLRSLKSDRKGKGRLIIPRDNDVDAASLHDNNEADRLPKDADSESSSLSDEDHDDDNDNAEEYESVSMPHERETDPRIMLREQLKRSESYRTPSSRPAMPKSAVSSREPKISLGNLSVPPTSNQDDGDAAGSLTASPTNHKAGRGLSPYRGQRHRPRRYFILTSAGKPVYSSSSPSLPRRREGEEEESEGEHEYEHEHEDSEESLASLVGVIQAIISLYAVENDRIRYIDAGELRIAFYLKAPLYLVAVSDWGEPESVLRTHLEYLYLQILSTVSLVQLQSIFEKHPGYDLRRTLSGTEGMMHHLIHDFLSWDFQALTNSLAILPLEPAVRSECTALLRPPKSVSKTAQNDMLYAILVAKGQIVTLLRPKNHSIHPSDLHILLNTIYATSALRTPNAEAWIPICLPKFNARGFVHAFISFFEDEDEGEGASALELGVVLITGNKEGFFDLREWKQSIHDRLTRPGHNGAPSLLTRLRSTTLPSLVPAHIPILRHWVYKSKNHVQLLAPRCFQGIYEESLPDRRRLVGLYSQCREAMTPTRGGRAPPKLIYAVGEEEAVLAMHSSSFEMYLAFPPLVPKKVASDAAHSFARWVAKNQEKLFLTGAPHF